MKQSVVVTQLADRHKNLHGRDFAESYEYVVDAGGLGEVLGQLNTLGFEAGRYIITVSEPFE